MPGYVKATELESKGQGPSACAKSCEDLGMRMTAMVLVGDQLPGCVCQPVTLQAKPQPAAAPSPPAAAPPPPAAAPPPPAAASPEPVSEAVEGAAASSGGYVVIAAAAAAARHQQQRYQNQLQHKK